MKRDMKVVLVLSAVLASLILFMGVRSMTRKGEASHELEPLMLSVTGDSKFFLESILYPDRARFEAALMQELRSQATRPVLLAADDALTYGVLQDVMEFIHASGPRRVLLGRQSGAPPLEVFREDPPRNIPPPDDQVVVRITREGPLTLNGMPVSDEEYQNLIRRSMNARSADDRVLFFLPDRHAPCGRVHFALETAKASGVKRLGMLTWDPFRPDPRSPQ